MKDYFQTAMKDILRYGLTSIHDAFVPHDMIEFFKQYVLLFTELYLGFQLRALERQMKESYQ